MFNSALYTIGLPLPRGQFLSDEEVNVSPILPVFKFIWKNVKQHEVNRLIIEKSPCEPLILLN